MINKIFVLFFFCMTIIYAQSVIIVVIDGARYSETFGAGATYIPNMWNNLKPLGTIYTNYWNLGSTSTNPGHATIATGIWQYVANNGTQRTDSATIFEYYRKGKLSPQSKNYVVVGKNKLNMLTYSYDPEYGMPYQADSASSLSLTDIQVYNNLISIMDNHHPDLIIVNLADVDLIAHNSLDGSDLTDYLDAITSADSLVYEIWQKIQSDSYYKNNTTLFVTNDHGRHSPPYDEWRDWRDHGDNCEGCQHIMLLALGRYIPQNVINNDPTDQRDIAPTVAELLNFSMPSAEGTSLLGGTIKFMDMEISNGWNMISLPLQHNTMLKTDIFPDAASSAWTYNGGYVEAISFEGGKGYWLKFNSAGSTEISGRLFDQTIPVVAGWNMIGPFDQAVNTLEIIYDPPDIRQSNFWGYNNGYLLADTLKPGKGYWVKISEAGTLSYPDGLGKTISINTHIPKNRLGKIILEDNSGFKANLFLVGENQSTSMNTPPPPPPTGSFEARFSNGNIVETIGERPLEIKLISPEYPIRICVEDVQIKLRDLANFDDVSETITPGEEYILHKNNSDIIQIAGAEEERIPAEFNLFQNYPNPFNPVTIIKYEIPGSTEYYSVLPSVLPQLHVKLIVYDILGREIKILLNKPQSPGIYEIEFNAGKLPSGIYFYRLEAGQPGGSGSFSETRKMILIK